MADSNGDWPCEAYGPEGIEFGALCFIAGQGERTCLDPAICHGVMSAQRRLLFQRIQEKAAAGDPDAIDFAEHFTSPDQLLGGQDTPEDRCEGAP